MAATVYNLTIEQGIPFTLEFLVKNENGSNKDLTGYTGRMQLRPYPSSTIIALDATSANSKVIINSAASTCTIVLTEIDTTNLSLNQYSYDIELVNSSGVPFRLTEGLATIKFQVTK